MRIVVLNNAAPFVRGGAELLADKLVVELERAGHQAELVRVPMAWSTPDLLVDSMLAAASLRVSNCDRVIALKFPVYLVSHDDVVVWLLHQFRQVYDLWDDPAGWPAGPRHAEVRDMVFAADRAALTRASGLFCNSTVTQGRLQEHLGIRADVLLPPLLQDRDFTSGPYGDYLLALGRVSGGKRQHLAVAAMAAVPPGAGRLVVAGAADTPEDAARLRSDVQRLGVHDRVQIIDGYITEEEKRDLLAGARAVVYAPIDEDSYGYVTLEAAYARRAVITAADSGGVLALVEDDVTGLVAAPDPQSLAEAFTRLLSSTRDADRLGGALRDRAVALGLTWSHVVDRLVS